MNNWTNEQLEAINKEGMNIVVSAGAGSGKTAVLTERVIRKIKDGISIDRLLILTFSKAAAEEMKERIKKKLIKENNIEQLNKLDSAYITTFDSFALSIIKKYHYLMNISCDIKITDNAVILIKKREILDNIFEELYSINSPNFNNFINDFCDKDDNIIKENILKISSKLDLKYDKLSYIKNYINSNYNEQKNHNFVKEYTKLIEIKIKELNCIVEEISYIVDSKYYIKLYDVLKPLLDSKNYEEIKNNCNLRLPNLINNEEAKPLKEQISEIIKEIKLLTEYSEQEQFEQIMSTIDNASVIMDIIYNLEEKIRNWKYEKDLFEFHDISRMSIELLKQNIFIVSEMKEQYNEILLDEYQDTNDLQEIFINLFMNNNVYMVGDMKQSIYRFRNANPNIFKEKYDKYGKGIDGYKIDLSKNFRTRKESIEDINCMFNQIMTKESSQIDYKDTHQMIYGNTDYINEDNKNYNIDIIEYEKQENYSNEEIEVFNIIKDIKNKIKNKYQVFDKDTNEMRDIKYDDFVILLDRKVNFDLYKKIFEYEEIPLTVYEEEKITDCYEIKLIYHILRLMNKVRKNLFDNDFKYSYMSIARSYLMELPDEVIFDNIKSKEYSNITKKINNLLSNQYSIEELLEKIIDEFEFYNKFIKFGKVEENLIKMEYINNLVKNLSLIGYNLNDITDYLEKIASNNYEIKFNRNQSRNNSVNLMTIHKSKGLEYPICYFPGLYPKFNQKDIKEKFIFDNEYGLIIPCCKEGLHHTILNYLLKNKYRKEEIAEKIRLFYVALTRSREKIILLFPEIENSKKEKINSFLDMIKIVYHDLEKYKYILNDVKYSKDYQKYEKIEKQIDNANDKFIVNELTINENSENKVTFSKKINKLIDYETFKNIEYGKKIHNILEMIDLKNPNYENIPDDIIKKIKKFIDCGLIKDNIKNIYQEYEFMYEEENMYHGVIDLILEYEDYIDIVDYKLKNIDDISYNIQLQGYKKYIENISNKKSNIYLYSILEEKLEKL